MSNHTIHEEDAMTYEAYSLQEETAKGAIVATAKAMLALGRCTCPRCGKEKLNPHGARNALSRRIDVIICDDCGTAEALSDFYCHPNYLSDWWIMGVIGEIKAILCGYEPRE